MTDNTLLEMCQSAYRKFHSTETALVKIVNDMLLAMDKRMCVMLVMLDLSAAFDTVNHETLLHRMETEYGITGHALHWIESYFANRTQLVSINIVQSTSKPLSTGLPQGSVLGPFGFLPYSSPLFSIAQRHGIELHMYADDTQLYLPFPTNEYDAAVAKMQSCLQDIVNWMNRNCLKLNSDKTEFLIIGSKINTAKIEMIFLSYS